MIVHDREIVGEGQDPPLQAMFSETIISPNRVLTKHLFSSYNGRVIGTKAVKRRVRFAARSESPGRWEGARETLRNMVSELDPR